MKSFVTKVTVGEFTAEGEGNSKKLAKRRAAAAVLQELKKLPPLPVIEKPRLYIKRRPKTIIKVFLIHLCMTRNMTNTAADITRLLFREATLLENFSC